MLAAVSLVLATGGIAAAAVNGGYPTDRARLLSGAAWLPSSQVGQLTLLDGASGEVAAQVQVADRGNQLEAVQQGSTGYAVNNTTGTVRRIDGATFSAGRPVSPVPNAKDGLLAIAGERSLFVLDSQRGVLASADPRTLAGKGSIVSLATEVSEQSAAIDRRGRLWALDRGQGDLVWIDNGRRHSRDNAVRAGRGGALVLVNGEPVVVDPVSHAVSTVDPDSGETHRTVRLDLRDDDEVQFGGSTNDASFYAVASRGVLIICDLGASSCGDAVPLGAGGQLGAPVESGGHLFVPDYASGKVWIVDLKHPQVIGEPKVMNERVRFQLLNRDGVVFFNDPNSENAGVIDLDGSVRRVRKYDPGDPTKGLVTNGEARGRQEPKQPSPEVKRTQSSDPRRSAQPERSSQSSPGQHTNGQQPPGQTPIPTTSSRAPATVRISMSKTTARVGEQVTLQAVLSAGASARSVQWGFGDGATATGATTTHSWSAVRTYSISLNVVLTSGEALSASAQIETTARPSVTLVTQGPGAVSGGGISCPGTCTATPDTDTVTLTAAPEYSSRVEWAGACTGSAATCTLDMSTDRNVTVTFRLPVAPLFTPANGAILIKPATPVRGYNRPLDLTWGAVAGAARYRLEVDYNGCLNSTTWRGFSGSDHYTEPNWTFDWYGPCQGRWRVTAIAADGTDGTTSAYWYFTYRDS